MTTPFPLLRLPRLALIPVFQQMEPIDIIAFSLLSKRAMHLSMLFKLKSLDFTLTFYANNIEMIFDLTCDQQLVLEYHIGNGRVIWRIEQKEIVWYNVGGLSAIECIFRVIQVTHCDLINCLSFSEMPQYNFLGLLPTLPIITEVSVSSKIPDALALRVMRVVLSKTSKLNLTPPNELRSMEKFQEILIGNLDIISIHRKIISGESFPFILDDLLMTNAVKIRLIRPTLKAKDLNRFFKLWMQNRCNPRLEYLAVWTEIDIKEDLLFKGLNAIQISDETTRTFWVSRYIKQRPSGKTISGGFDIRRIDGTKGTIGFRKIFGMVDIRFYVWS